jgi:prolyl oligopeptidase
LFLETNWKAPNGRVLATPVGQPGTRERWMEIVPERPYALESAAAIGDKLILSYLENASSRVVMVTPGGAPVREIALPAIGTVTGIAGDWNSNEAFYGFTSYNQPLTWYRFDVATGDQKIWFQPNLPMDPTKFDVQQVWYESRDGTRVPMFLFHKQGLKPDSNTPALLYGYGGFNVNLTPAFNSTALVWAELGGIYAVANLRGGGEFGEKWHEAGMREHKQNVFDDFIAAAEWLIGNHYSSPSKLAIEGGSNGGLLTGAALTQHPGLFGAVICAVPLLDMIRYHEFKVARFWVPEYGSAEDSSQFEYLYNYSPYHHVDKGRQYPAVLFVTGDSDTRVDPLHARKMTALLQASTASAKPILLYYDTKSGHAGGKPVSRLIDDATAELVFLTSQLGVSPSDPA